MVLHKTSTVSRGFTLIEVLIAIGMLSIVVACTTLVDMGSYRGDAFRREKSTLATLLQKARADALANVDHVPHGVAIFPAGHESAYVLFAGASYLASDPATHEVIETQYPVELATSSPSELVFAQLSAASQNATITLVDPQRQASSSISITSEGMIDW